MLNGKSEVHLFIALASLGIVLVGCFSVQEVLDITQGVSYPIVDTRQMSCYDASGKEIPCPEPVEPLYGRDAHFTGNAPRYVDNGDGTITDLITGLMWAKDDSGFGMT